MDLVTRKRLAVVVLHRSVDVRSVGAIVAHVGHICTDYQGEGEIQ